MLRYSRFNLVPDVRLIFHRGAERFSFVELSFSPSRKLYNIPGRELTFTICVKKRNFTFLLKKRRKKKTRDEEWDICDICDRVFQKFREIFARELIEF